MLPGNRVRMDSEILDVIQYTVQGYTSPLTHTHTATPFFPTTSHHITCSTSPTTSTGTLGGTKIPGWGIDLDVNGDPYCVMDNIEYTNTWVRARTHKLQSITILQPSQQIPTIERVYPLIPKNVADGLVDVTKNFVPLEPAFWRDFIKYVQPIKQPIKQTNLLSLTLALSPLFHTGNTSTRGSWMAPTFPPPSQSLALVIPLSPSLLVD